MREQARARWPWRSTPKDRAWVVEQRCGMTFRVNLRDPLALGCLLDAF